MQKNEKKAAGATIHAAGSDGLLRTLLILVNLYLFLRLCHVDMGHRIFTIKDLGDLFEGRAFSLNEDEVYPNRFNNIPKLQDTYVLENRDHQKNRKIQ